MTVPRCRRRRTLHLGICDLEVRRDERLDGLKVAAIERLHVGRHRFELGAGLLGVSGHCDRAEQCERKKEIARALKCAAVSGARELERRTRVATERLQCSSHVPPELEHHRRSQGEKASSLTALLLHRRSETHTASALATRAPQVTGRTNTCPSKSRLAVRTTPARIVCEPSVCESETSSVPCG